MVFVCDPSFDGVPVVGAGVSALVARRTQCGSAVRWVPGGDVYALVAFLGAPYVLVNGRVFLEGPDGVLLPESQLDQEWVYVRPPAGEVFRVDKWQFVPQFARVNESVSEVAGEGAGFSPFPAPDGEAGAAAVSVSPENVCGDCGREFVSPAGLKAHRTKVHGG